MAARNESDLSINVMMVGGRRCGKTTVLASMQNCFEAQCSGTPLVIGPANEEMLDVLEEKQNEINRYFLERGKTKGFVPDSNPTSDVNEYSFYIRVKDKKSQININFIDYPGEWIGDKIHAADLKEYMDHSRILIVTIDTPHLMEQKGLYNDYRNRCKRITEMVKTVGFSDAGKGPGMILFVPLKCEKYYQKGQMEEVAAKTKEAYGSLLSYLQQPGENERASQITVAITPILTMGGAEFSRFARDEDGNIDVDAVSQIPKQAVYYFPDMTKDRPEPLHCEQPLLYILSYVFNQTLEIKKNQSNANSFLEAIFKYVVNVIQEGILNWSSADDYLNQRDAVNERLKYTGDGYVVLNKGILR